MAGKPSYRKQIRSWESEGFDVSELRREFEKSARRKKIRVASAIILIALCVSPFIYHQKWKQSQLSKHLIEAEQLLDQKRYTEAWEKVQEASKYGSSEKSDRMALLKAELESHKEATKIKEEMQRIKAGLDLHYLKKFDLEENYKSLLFDERKGLDYFETHRFREAKSVFGSTRDKYAELSNKVLALQKTEQERVEKAEKEGFEREKSERERLEREKSERERAERLKLKALRAKEEMEILKKLIDIHLVRRHIRDEFEASLSQESRGLKAFESGRYEEAKVLFQSATAGYSELIGKIGAIIRAEEEKADREMLEKLKQEAAQARSGMEVAKNKLDLRLVEKFGAKQEYHTLLFEESKGKENVEANRYSEAKEVFQNVRDAYVELYDKIRQLQKIEIEKAESEKLRQKALKAKADMELVKKGLDINMIQKYKAKSEYDSWVDKEKEGKKCLEDGKFEEARNIFEEINKGYTGLDWQRLRRRYNLDIVPVSVNFGSVRVLGWNIAGRIRSKTILVTNKGTQSIGIKEAIIESPIQGEFNFSFWVNKGCLLPKFGRHYLILNPGESCKQDIDFTPIQVGARSANLTILLDDPDSTRIKVLMVGQGM